MQYKNKYTEQTDNKTPRIKNVLQCHIFVIHRNIFRRLKTNTISYWLIQQTTIALFGLQLTSKTIPYCLEIHASCLFWRCTKTEEKHEVRNVSYWKSNVSNRRYKLGDPMKEDLGCILDTGDRKRFGKIVTVKLPKRNGIFSQKRTIYYSYFTCWTVSKILVSNKAGNFRVSLEMYFTISAKTKWWLLDMNELNSCIFRSAQGFFANPVTLK